MSLSEADTRAKLIDPALHRRGWTEDLIRREETARGIEIIDGKPRRRERGRTDYLLRVRVNISSQPVAIALIEAKRSDEPPGKGLEQAKKYARLNNVPFVYSSNGHLFVEYNHFTGKTTEPLPVDEFPTPDELRKCYEHEIGFSLETEIAKPLLASYPGGDASRRFYQDAAIRATLEKIAQGKKRLLLYLATGSGKTFIAVHLLKKIADAGQLRRALFLCDRDELRSQGLAAFQNVFGADAAEVTTKNPQKNARILIATYQTLNVAGDTEDAKFFIETYPENYFSHIIINLDLTGVAREDIERLGLKDAISGQRLMVSEAREHYEALSFENIIQLPDRVKTMCRDLFEMLLQTGGPHQKTVIFFFKYVRSPIAFQQMMGRGSRIHLPSNKLMFRVCDYTNATRLLGEEFVSRLSPAREPTESGDRKKEKIIRVEGFDVHINPAGIYIVTKKEGKLAMVTLEEYKQMLAQRLVEEVKTSEEFRKYWIDPLMRKGLIDMVPDGERGLRLFRELTNRQDYDLYDVLAEICYGMPPKSRVERVEALRYKHDTWFKSLPEKTTNTLFALAKQFERGGTDELENPRIFITPDVVRAGGFEALKNLGNPNEIINETKRRLFAA